MVVFMWQAKFTDIPTTKYKGIFNFLIVMRLRDNKTFGNNA